MQLRAVKGVFFVYRCCTTTDDFFSFMACKLIPLQCFQYAAGRLPRPGSFAEDLHVPIVQITCVATPSLPYHLSVAPLCCDTETMWRLVVDIGSIFHIYT